MERETGAIYTYSGWDVVGWRLYTSGGKRKDGMLVFGNLRGLAYGAY